MLKFLLLLILCSLANAGVKFDCSDPQSKRLVITNQNENLMVPVENETQCIGNFELFPCLDGYLVLRRHSQLRAEEMLRISSRGEILVEYLAESLSLSTLQKTLYIQTFYSPRDSNLVELTSIRLDALCEVTTKREQTIFGQRRNGNDSNTPPSTVRLVDEKSYFLKFAQTLASPYAGGLLTRNDITLAFICNIKKCKVTSLGIDLSMKGDLIPSMQIDGDRVVIDTIARGSGASNQFVGKILSDLTIKSAHK